jgi:acyl-CoA oxidase
MSDPTTLRALLDGDHPRLAAVLPMVLAAWDDGVLTSGERRAFADTLLTCPALEVEDRKTLLPWLDPARPPTSGALAELRRRVRTLAPPVAGEAASLTELGMDLAGAVGARGAWRHRDARQALAEAEASLGILGREAVRRLLGPEPGEGESGPAPGEGPPLFDVTRLQAFLAEPHAGDRERVLALLREPVLDPDRSQPREAYREAVLQAVRRLAAEGMGSLGYPRAAGGQASPGRAMAVFETLALGDLSVLVKFGVQFGLFGGSVLQLGTERHHRRHLGAIGTLALPGCYAMTEIGHGSNVRELETVARYRPADDTFEVHSPVESAGKAWIGNAAVHGRMATVFAQLEVGEERHGVHAFLVPIRDDRGLPLPGVRIEDEGPKIGLEGVDNGRIWFDRVRVPRENLLDRFGRVDDEGLYQSPIPSPGRRFFTMLGTLVAGRVSIAAASVSAAKTGLTIAIRHSARRRQFGPEGEPEIPVLDYLTQQRLLLPALATTYGFHFAVRDLVQRYETLTTDPGSEPGEESRALEVRAAGLKALASWHCVDTLQACREAMGGRGYHADNRLGALRADTDIFTTFEGANVVLLQLVARGLLTRFREEMGDLRFWDVVRHLTERAQTRVQELNPVVTRRTDDDHLQDPDFHAAAFRYREARLLASVARRLKGRIDDDMDSFAAMNEVQDHLVTLARAHVEGLVLDAFQDAVVRAPTPGLSETLRTLQALYALSRMEADRAWFLEAGYFDPPKARAVRTQVNRLVAEVREQALFLVEAFGIPDEVLRAPDGKTCFPSGGLATLEG